MTDTAKPPGPPYIVLDDLLALTEQRAEDAATHRQFGIDPAAARFFGWTVEQAESQFDSYYDDVIRQFARDWQEGTCFSLVIRRRSNGQAVGFVELRPCGNEASVSYGVLLEQRG